MSLDKWIKKHCKKIGSYYYISDNQAGKHPDEIKYPYHSIQYMDWWHSWVNFGIEICLGDIHFTIGKFIISLGLSDKEYCD